MDLFQTTCDDDPPRGLAEHLGANRADVRERLRAHGALLFRGFDVGGVDGFEAAVRAISGQPLAYDERSSPRSTIKGNIYTSTDYPAQEEIFFHSENSYRTSWPMTLYFHCVQPPATLGATPLADTRQVLRLLDPSVVEGFRRRRWMVVRNFGDYGVPWREAFGTDDRQEVQRYCAEHDIGCEWKGDDLRTTSVRDAIHRHPETGAEVWFNHVAIFHVSTRPPEVRASMLELFDEEDLPSNTYFGDGGRIPDDVMDHIRDCYRRSSVRFDYQRDDVVVVDNMLTAHGREPFTGPRRIAVAMAEPMSVART
jgi:alpha-ketoglutarate-dependent taurine dioxygenase